VIGEAATGEEAVRSVQMLSPSVVVMDIKMPRLNGIEATARIKQTCPDVVVVGLSMNAEDHRHAMIAAGATTVIAKEAAGEQLYDAIIVSASKP
jgi:DNA-binding NarL/FixJ family response regulator